MNWAVDKMKTGSRMVYYRHPYTVMGDPHSRTIHRRRLRSYQGWSASSLHFFSQGGYKLTVVKFYLSFKRAGCLQKEKEKCVTKKLSVSDSWQYMSLSEYHSELHVGKSPLFLLRLFKLLFFVSMDKWFTILQGMCVCSPITIRWTCNVHLGASTVR